MLPQLASLPTRSQIVRVRTRHWLLEGVLPSARNDSDVDYLNNHATQFAAILANACGRLVAITDLPQALIGKGAA